MDLRHILLTWVRWQQLGSVACNLSCSTLEETASNKSIIGLAWKFIRGPWHLDGMALVGHGKTMARVCKHWNNFSTSLLPAHCRLNGIHKPIHPTKDFHRVHGATMSQQRQAHHQHSLSKAIKSTYCTHIQVAIAAPKCLWGPGKVFWSPADGVPCCIVPTWFGRHSRVYKRLGLKKTISENNMNSVSKLNIVLY